MALSTYSDLKQTVKDFLHRTDLDGVIPTFVTLAESEFNRRIRVREMEVRATSAATQYLTMPTDFLELRNIQLNTDPLVSLQYMSPQDIDLHYGFQTGKPQAFTFVANQFQFAPDPGDGGYEVEIDYYQKIPALSDANTTNWLLTSYPDVYLAGSMVQAAWYLMDEQLKTAWQMRMDIAIDQLTKSNNRATFGGPNMAVRADIVSI